MNNKIQSSTKTLILILIIALVAHSIIYVKTVKVHQDFRALMNSLQETNLVKQEANPADKLTEPAPNDEQIDYDRIELIIEKKLNEYNKPFEERFEEASSYFEQKTKDTIESLSDQFSK